MKRRADGSAVTKESGSPSAKKSKKASRKQAPMVDEHAILCAALDDPLKIQNYLTKQIQKYRKDLSSVELADLTVPENAISVLSLWKKPRTDANLPDFLTTLRQEYASHDSLHSAPKDKGSPHTLVITASGIRAAELVRVLRQFQTRDASVAKLFAKHLKLKDTIDYLQRSRIGIGVGTPARILDLLKSGALASRNLNRLIVDATYLDEKQRGILSMQDTLPPLIDLLGWHEFDSRCDNTDLRIAFY